MILTFILSLVVQIIVLVSMIYFQPPNYMWWCTVLALTSILTVAALYWMIIWPLRMLTLGADLLLGQDFGSRLRTTGYGEVDRLAQMYNEMMDHLHRERLAVRETNRYLDRLIESAPMGVINFDTEDRLVMANQAALLMLGVTSDEELKGLHPDSLPGRLGRMIAELEPGESRTLDARPDEGDDNIYKVSRFSFVDYGFPRTAIHIEKLTEVVRITERQAYNKLIRVMAHEINNSMGAVTSTFDLLSETPELMADEDLASLVDSCNHRCRSLCNFIDRYASVARLPRPELMSMDMSLLLERCAPVLRHTAMSTCAGADVKIYAEGAIMTDIDPVQMEQVLVNLVKNSAESIARKTENKGKIIIAADPKERTLTVIDDGVGIDEDTAAKLFTPFFTTKRQSSLGGTGLTLTAEILRAHGFRFSLKTSSEDGLTRFRIML